MAGLGGLILIYGQEPTWFWANRWDLTIYVDSPTGIEEGTPAYLQGVLIGRVKEIGFKDVKRPGAGAAVIVEVDDVYDVPIGTEATLHPSFGFDKGAINLVPPQSVDARPVDRNANAIVGRSVGPLEAIVPPEFVATLVDAVEEIGTVSARVGQVADDLHVLLQLRTIEEVDDPNSPVPANFYTAVQRFDQSLRLLNEILGEDQSSDLRATIASWRVISEDLKTWTAQLDPRTEVFLREAHVSMTAIAQRVTTVAESLTGRLDQMAVVLDDGHAILDGIARGQGTAGLIVQDARLYEELVTTVQNIAVMVDDLKALAVWIQTESMLKRGL
jgi:hypothetical protein